MQLSPLICQAEPAHLLPPLALLLDKTRPSNPLISWHGPRLNPGLYVGELRVIFKLVLRQVVGNLSSQAFPATLNTSLHQQAAYQQPTTWVPCTVPKHCSQLYQGSAHVILLQPCETGGMCVNSCSNRQKAQGKGFVHGGGGRAPPVSGAARCCKLHRLLSSSTPRLEDNSTFNLQRG